MKSQKHIQGAYKVEWLNPATGIAIDAGQIDGGQRHALTSPFDSPAVLYLYLMDQEQN